MNKGKFILWYFLAQVWLCTIACASCQKQQQPEPTDITVDQFINLSKEKNYVLLDVRTSREYKSGHLREANLIDISTPEATRRINSLDKTKIYYVYCQTGIRSRSVVKYMRREGFEKSYNITGGIVELQNRGFELNR